MNIVQGLFVRCDLVEIEQVLVNLFGNAIDAVKTKEGSWIRVNAFAEGEQVVVQVIDSGLGISPECRAKIFDPFFTTKVIGEGTGLGLSISKGIVDDHGGSLALNSSEKNTCFELRLPKVTRAT